MKILEFVPERQTECSVEAWLHIKSGYTEEEMKDFPAIIICPGGAYMDVARREGEPVAAAFYGAGYHTFILRYSIGERAKNFEPLCQLAAAMAYIRSHAKEWHVLPDKIAVCGFSAGGHLAASLGVLFNEPKFLEVYQKEEKIRPDAMILSYPVITSDQFAHVESIENGSGAKRGSAEYAWFGLDKHVDADTPPTFLWHTAEDSCVPVENSLKMSAALSAAKVPFELHVLPEGPHGMSVCTEEIDALCPYNARWVEWCVAWLRELWA